LNVFQAFPQGIQVIRQAQLVRQRDGVVEKLLGIAVAVVRIMSRFGTLSPTVPILESSPIPSSF
jgi:hypothetical protein